MMSIGRSPSSFEASWPDLRAYCHSTGIKGLYQ
jgi:hypothetical protein